MIVSFCVGFALAGDACFAHGYKIKSLEILHPSIAVPKPGSSETCAYVTIVNHGNVIERLTGLRTPVSEQIPDHKVDATMDCLSLNSRKSSSDLERNSISDRPAGVCF